MSSIPLVKLPSIVRMNSPSSNRNVPKCRVCNRKQYVKSARCLCGWIEATGSLEGLEIKRAYEKKRRKRLNKVLECLATRNLTIAWSAWRYFVKRSKHRQQRKHQIPPHAFLLLNKKEEIRKLLQRRKRHPDSPSLLNGELLYESTLAVERKRQNDKALEKDLEGMKLEYMAKRKLHKNHSSFQPSVARRKRIVHEYFGGDGDEPSSRMKPMISIDEATTVEEVVALLNAENKLLIDARKSNDRWVKRRARRRQTIAQIKKERQMREARERREREAAAKLAEEMRRKGNRERAAKLEAASKFHSSLMKWKTDQLKYGLSTWCAFMRIETPPTLSEYLERELERDQDYQLRGVKMRRRLRLYGS